MENIKNYLDKANNNTKTQFMNNMSVVLMGKLKRQEYKSIEDAGKECIIGDYICAFYVTKKTKFSDEKTILFGPKRIDGISKDSKYIIHDTMEKKKDSDQTKKIFLKDDDFKELKAVLAWRQDVPDIILE